MNKKILILVIVLGILCGIGITIFTAILVLSPTPKDLSVIETTESTTAIAENTTEAVTAPDIEKDTGKPFEPVAQSGQAITSEDEENIITKARELIRKFEFLGANEILKQARFEYIISPESEIQTLYNDCAYLQHIQSGVLSETYNAIDMIRVLKDPETVLVAMLYLDGYHREPFVRDDRSLSPEYFGSIEITKVEELTESHEIYTEIFRTDVEISSVYKFEITLDGNDIFAYIAKSTSETYLYRLDEAVPGTTGYFTIKHLREMEALSNGGQITNETETTTEISDQKGDAND